MTFRWIQTLAWIAKSVVDYLLLKKVCRFREKRILMTIFRILLNAVLSLNTWTIQSFPLWLAWILQVLWDLIMILDLRGEKEPGALFLEHLVYSAALESSWVLSFCVTWKWSSSLLTHSGNIFPVIAGMLVSLLLETLQFYTIAFQKGRKTAFDSRYAVLLLSVTGINILIAQGFVNSNGKIGIGFILAAGLYSILIFAGVRNLFRQAELDKREQSLKHASKLLEQAQERAEEKDLELQEIRHSLKDHLMILQTLHRQNHYEEVDQYLQRLLNDCGGDRYFFYCSDPVLNALLNQMVLAHPDVRFNMVINPDLQALPFPIIEALFLAADNACEELENHPELSQQVDVSLDQVRGKLVCTICNPLSKQKDLQTEKGGSEHGIGLRRIRRLIEGLDGQIGITQDKYFELTMTIPMEPGFQRSFTKTDLEANPE